MGKIIGIDLGTTHSLVAVVEAGIPGVLADEKGRRLTPSVVHFSGPEQAPLAGWEARRIRVAHPETTVSSVKRLMGLRGIDLDTVREQMVHPLSANGTSPVTLPIHGHDWTPEKISAEILKVLKATASQRLGEEITQAVITVPAYFNDAQRNATKKAGELAGLRVERIVNEPTAAALAFGLDKLGDKACVAVYDLGGGTFDLSILELNKGVFQVLATCGDTQLGGDDIDHALIDHLAGEIRAAGGPDILRNRTLLARVREAAEQAKIELSESEVTGVSLPFLTPEFSFSKTLDRPTLESLSKPVINRMRQPCLRAMADAGLKNTDLDQVILVGGQTRMPKIREFAAELFGCGQEGGSTLNISQNPDEAVALGAAIQAGILSGAFENLLLLDVTPLSLGLETFGGLMNVLIPRNTTIPVKKGEQFTTAADYQKEILIHVLQGERERVVDNWSLGKFTLDFESAPKGVARVGVQFEIDADGILHVLARDLKTGKEKVVAMQSAVDVDDSAVQQMIEESLEHAFQDIEARREVEARLRAEQTLEAVRKGMKECGRDLSDDQNASIREVVVELETLLTVPEEAGVGNLEKLKQATQKLDQSSQPLADLMMDRVMARMLEQRGVLPSQG